MRNVRAVGIAVLCLVVSGGTGCTTSSGVQCVCTEQFVSSLVDVLAPSGEPATDLDIVVTRVNDGVDVTPPQGQGASGRVVVLTDAQLDFVSVGGTSFEATITGAEGQATATFVFATDDCRCHIIRVSGPETVQLVATP